MGAVDNETLRKMCFLQHGESFSYRFWIVVRLCCSPPLRRIGNSSYADELSQGKPISIA